MTVNPKKGRKCWMDISIDGQPAGRVVYALEWGECPRTCENFRALCAGDAGHVPGHPDVPLHYQGSRFHLAIPGFIVQGGDFTAGDGSGGWSIYGGSFADEFFVRAHSGPGMLCMANSGPNTNCSQFYITLAEAQHLNGRSMVFGRVVKGMGVVRRIAQCETGEGDALEAEVVITDCGDLGKDEDDGVPPDPLDKWEDHPLDNLTPPDDCDKLRAAEEIRAAGNALFKEGRFLDAAAKYTKAVEYLRAARCRPEKCAPTEDAEGRELRVHRKVSVMHRRREEDDPDPSLDCSELLEGPGKDAPETGTQLDHGDVVAVLESVGDDDTGYSKVRCTHGPCEGAVGWVRTKDLHVQARVENLKRFPEKKEVIAAKIACFRNRSACHLKLERWADARRATREALKLEGGDQDAKVLWRHAEALYRLAEDDDEALRFARKAEELAPGEPQVQRLVRSIVERRRRKTQRFGAKMSEAIEHLGDTPDRLDARFRDRETLKEVVFWSPKRGHVTYTLNGQERDAVREVRYDPKGPLLQFPDLRKKVNLPSSEQELRPLLARIREVAQEAGAEHNIPAPDSAAFPFAVAP